MRLPRGAINLFLRHIEKRHLARETDVLRVRRRLDLQALCFFRDPPFATYLRERIDNELHLNATWVAANIPRKRGVILYFHGGGYVMGTPISHRAMLARLSELTGLRALLPDYRLAPEHPFPAAVDDALAAYQCMLNRGYEPDQIVLGGDSAGGGLMLALLHMICANDMPRPGAAFAFSPWTDLTLSGKTLETNARADPFLPASRAVEMRDMYLAGADPDDPRASPLFGTYRGAPPVMITVADSEILLDDSRRIADVLRAAGCSIQLEIYHDLPHVWPIFQGHLKDADATLREVAAFLSRTLQ
ncbi:MAG: alpha/beta hydrolase [Paracoccaceae bacterium]